MQVGGNRAEFHAYGVLHAASLKSGLLSQELCQLPRDVLDDPFITHALATVNAYRCVCCADRQAVRFVRTPLVFVVRCLWLLCSFSLQVCQQLVHHIRT